jgi:hypothetical protein
LSPSLPFVLSSIVSFFPLFLCPFLLIPLFYYLLSFSLLLHFILSVLNFSLSSVCFSIYFVLPSIVSFLASYFVVPLFLSILLTSLSVCVCQICIIIYFFVHLFLCFFCSTWEILLSHKTLLIRRQVALRKQITSKRLLLPTRQIIRNTDSFLLSCSTLVKPQALVPAVTQTHAWKPVRFRDLSECTRCSCMRTCTPEVTQLQSSIKRYP